MKSFYLFLLFTVCGPCIFAQAVFSTCTGEGEIISQYRDDADRLTVRITQDGQSSYNYTPYLNHDLGDTMLNALIAVYNVTGIAARDTIIDQLNIHTFSNPHLRTFVIAADSNLLWMSNLRNHEYPTGNLSVDQLMGLYDLHFDGYEAWDFMPYHSVWLTGNENYNISALANEFAVLPGVFYAEGNMPNGDGDNISAHVTTDYVELIYTHGWDDCNSGCISRRHWKFEVYYDCSVIYKGSFGDDLPGEETSGLTENNPADAGIYPNPFRDEIHLGKLTKDAPYVLQNLLGQAVSTGETSGKTISGLSDLPEGIYFIVYEQNGRHVREKLVHQ